MLTRRAVMAGMAAGFGGLRRRPDQVSVPPIAVLSPNSQSGILRARIVIVFGASGGVFVYDPAVAAGKLIASVTDATSSPTGDSTLQGITSYFAGHAPTHAVQLHGGGVTFSTAPSEAGPWAAVAQIQPSSSNKDLQLQSLAGSVILGAATAAVAFAAPSGDVTGVTDTAVIAAAISAYGSVVLSPGTWHVNCGDPTLTALGPGQYIICSGDKATIINALGSGDLFYWTNTSGSISDGNTTGGGLIGGATIDGSATTSDSTGIHAGDINALRFDCRCQHFTAGTASWGFLFDNANFFTERMHLNIRAKDCGSATGGGMAGFTVTGATTSTGSFARLKGRIEITQGSSQQDGLVLNNGAHIYDMELEVIGNFQGGASATTAAALRITGTVPAGHPGAGTRSAISNGRLDIGVECSSGAHTPITFVQGNSSNSITSTYGNINWNNNFTSSGITGPGFKFAGQVQGDTALGTRLYYGTAPTQTITGNGQTISATVPSAKIPVSAGAPGFTATVLSPGDEDGQLIFLIGTGTSTVAFDVAGTSNVAAGVAAVLSAGKMMPLIWDAGSALWYNA